MNPIVVFVIVFILDSISFFGYSKVASILSLFYCKFFHSELFNSIAQSKKEVIHLKKKLNDISCQDEFAKWVKVNRRLTAATAKYEEIASKGNSAQTSATLTINLALKVLLVGTKLLLLIFLRKEPMFVASKEWLGQLTYFLTTKDSIHIFVWMLICSNISKRILNAIKTLKTEGKIKQN